MSKPDPRPPKRVRDPELLRRLHLRWRECVLSDDTCVERLSLHHVRKHPRDDLECNLVMLCGCGVTGHHGRIEAHEPKAKLALMKYLRASRPDVISYLHG